MRHPKSIFLEGAHGNRLHLADWGGDGPGLLLLHGMAANTAWWDPVVPLLLPGRRIVALDMRGHGDSAWAQPYSLDAYAADLEAVRRGLGWDRFALAAHSLGARVALRFVSRGCLTALALLDFYAADWGGRTRASMARAQPTYADEEAILDRFRLQPPGTLLGPDALRSLGRRGVRQASNGRWSWKFDWSAVGQSVVWDPTEPSRADLPVLLVRGEASETMPRWSFKNVLAALPDARGIEIPHAHHHVTLDAPQACAAALDSFLESIPLRF